MRTKLTLLMVMVLLSGKMLMAQNDKTGANNNNKVSTGEGAFSKGDMSLSIASGFGISYDYYGTYVSLPALTVAYDVGIVNDAGPGNIGVGGIVGFKKAYNRHDGYDATWSNYLIAARGTYHLTVIDNDKFDPYGGVTLGIRIYDYRDPYFDERYNPYKYNSVYPIVGAFVGAKYNFTRGFGGFVELGYDISLIRIGVSFNF
jgi:hypothetical protein